MLRAVRRRLGAAPTQHPLTDLSLIQMMPQRVYYNEHLHGDWHMLRVSDAWGLLRQTNQNQLDRYAFLYDDGIWANNGFVPVCVDLGPDWLLYLSLSPSVCAGLDEGQMFQQLPPPVVKERACLPANLRIAVYKLECRNSVLFTPDKNAKASPLSKHDLFPLNGLDRDKYIFQVLLLSTQKFSSLHDFVFRVAVSRLPKEMLRQSGQSNHVGPPRGRGMQI